MPTKTIYKGTCRSIFYWSRREEALGDLEAWLKSNAHTSSDREKIARLLRQVCENSNQKLHPSSEKWAHEFDKIYALKAFQIRLYGIMRGVDFLILHFDKKKRTKLAKITKAIIENIYKDYLKEQKQGA